MAKSRKVQYLHLPEAAPKNEKEEAIVGKTLAYLVTDFIKANQSAS
jgi:formiminoglutamase